MINQEDDAGFSEQDEIINGKPRGGNNQATEYDDNDILSQTYDENGLQITTMMS